MPSETTAPAVETDLTAVLEAMLFASPEPLTWQEICESLPDYEAQELERGLDALRRELERESRGLKLQQIAGGFRLVTRPELAEHLRAMFRLRNRKRLTPATLDVLSIVAYAQPITTPEIQEVRGTDPTYAIRVLQDRKLIRVVGRKRVVGRPILYGTTKEFLVHFGLDSLGDLPPVEAYGTQVISSQSRLFPATGGEGGDNNFEPIDDEADGPPLPNVDSLTLGDDLSPGKGLALAAAGVGRTELHGAPVVESSATSGGASGSELAGDGGND